MSALRNIRERKGFNLSQLASRSGISGKTLLEYEEGRAILPLAHARLLAKALWVEVDELMPPPGTTPPSQPSPPAQQPQPQAQMQPTPGPTQEASVQAVMPAQISTPQVTSPLMSQQPVMQQQPLAPARQPEAHIPQTQGAQRGRPDVRAPRAPKPVPPVTEGQVQELLQLASRLDISQEQLEERVGKALATLTRPEATDWVKRLRAIADEIAPATRVKYGRWPDSNEDKEAAYLARQREAGTLCTFRLFNGEEFSGSISDFTPYTITIKVAESQEEVVLRKLAVAYYRCTHASGSEATTGQEQPATPAQDQAPEHNHARDDHHQHIDTGVDSDRVGEPETPERDRMDKDRGM